MTQPADFRFSWRDVAKVLLKAQLYVVVFLGLLSTTLVYFYWGFSLNTLLSALGLYVAAYILFAVIFLLISIVLLRRTQPVLDQVAGSHELELSQVQEVARFLLNFPWRASLLVFGVYILIVVPMVYLTSVDTFLPETSAILGAQRWYMLATSLVLAAIDGVLNYIFLEQVTARQLSLLVHRYPKVLSDAPQARRISLFTKIFMLMLLTVLSGPVVIFGAIMVKLAIVAPSVVASSFILTAVFMVFTILYVIFVARVFTGTLATSLQFIERWSRSIMRGVREPLYLLTNDELSDVATSANRMVSNLEQLTHEVELDRDSLVAERDKLLTVIHQISDGVVALDEHGKVLLFSPAAERLTEWREKELFGQTLLPALKMGRSNGEAFSLPKSDGAQDSPFKAPYFYDAPVQISTKSGETRFVGVAGSRMYHPGVSQIVYILSLHDVSKEQELERMKFDFVTLAAHELRTPLTALQGYLSLLVKTGKNDLDQDSLLYAQRSLDSTHQLSSLIENLLNVARIEQGQMQLRLELVSLKDAVSQAVKRFEMDALQKKVGLELVIKHQRLPEVMADAFLLQEVLTNLIANALHYTEGGGRVIVSVDKVDQELVVQVQDNGAGIPAEAQLHLFEKFYRAHERLQQAANGAGLGLFISREILKRFDGKIWVESALGAGSTFSFSIPIPHHASHKELVAKRTVRRATKAKA